MKLSRFTKGLIIVLAILIIDQVIKISIKLTMDYGENFNMVGSWFKIHFIENTGMAFGMDIGGSAGKLGLTIFRIIAVGLITWYMYRESKKKVHFGLIICLSMIIAGAFGNIVDSAAYGLAFDEGITIQEEEQYHQLRQEGKKYEASTHWEEMYKEKANMNGEGYAPFLMGSVVDMFQFDMTWPKWVPGLGGDQVFPPIWNFADASITLGIISLILFQGFFYREENAAKKKEAGEEPEEKKGFFKKLFT
jgi:signal peptidase II